MANESERKRRPSKVERVTEKYGLDGFGDELVERWTATEDSDSLRELATLMNHEILRSALRDAGSDPLEGEVENTYRLLTSDETTEGMRVQARSTLEAEGVDVDDVLSDFVSHQAVYTYLTDYRGVSKDSEKETDRIANVLNSVQRLRGRLVAVVEKSLESLRNTGRIRLGDFDVLVDTRVYCHECGTQYDVTTLLERGGCDCEDDGDAETETA